MVQGNPAFLEKVTIWQRKLGAVDMVLSAWTDVQRKWQGLQSIFVGSADIRVQLPEDSARFDTLNIDFQVRACAHAHAHAALLLRIAHLLGHLLSNWLIWLSQQSPEHVPY